jgi:hypothetical protein
LLTEHEVLGFGPGARLEPQAQRIGQLFSHSNIAGKVSDSKRPVTRIEFSVTTTENTANESLGVSALCADADGAGLARDTTVADLNIVGAGGEVLTGGESRDGVVAASRVAQKRMQAGGGVAAAGRVAEQRTLSIGVGKSL